MGGPTEAEASELGRAWGESRRFDADVDSLRSASDLHAGSGSAAPGPRPAETAAAAPEVAPATRAEPPPAAAEPLSPPRRRGGGGGGGRGEREKGASTVTKRFAGRRLWVVLISSLLKPFDRFGHVYWLTTQSVSVGKSKRGHCIYFSIFCTFLNRSKPLFVL